MAKKLSPIEQVRLDAQRRRGEHHLGLATDATADPVLIAVATADCSLVIQVDKAEYEPNKVLSALVKRT